MTSPDLLPLADADTIRRLDRLTCARQHITSLQLMERAAARCTARLLACYPDNRHWTIIAGAGNNGGDGLAIARQLHMQGHHITAYHPQQQRTSPDHAANAARLARLIPTRDLAAYTPPTRGIQIDALYGVGLNRPLAAADAGLIRAMNRAPVPTIAIDLPSGLRADADSPAPVIRAVRTLCLGCPKPALLWQENEDYVGTLELLPIGLDHAALADTPAAAHWLTAAWLRGEYRPRRRFAHKGDAGRLLIIAGSRGMTGAAIMAAQAALRGGCGLLTAHLPAACCTAYHAAVPEAMTDADTHPDHNTRLTRDLPTDALLIGCGCGTHPDTAALIADLNSRYHDRAILWDADALNHLARDPALQQHLPPRSILTPHPGEFARLSGTPLAHDRERIPAAQALAARLNAVIILKGKYSIISAPDGSTAINPTGNAGMAKGGSGDVLAGLTAALLAQGYPPFTAACLGTYLHGLAADLALKNSAINSLTASDIISAIPAAWRNIAAEPA